MLPFFYQAELPVAPGLFVLDEATSKHCILVLRMKIGEQMRLTDGKGVLAKAEIVDDNRKRCGVKILTIDLQQIATPEFSLAIAFTKNNSRNEWLLEKTTEMGIHHIFPLQTRRGEKDKLKYERLNGILVSAMLQSQQCHLPVLHEPISLKDLLADYQGQKFVAHCVSDAERRDYLNSLAKGENTLVLVGPEGDFDDQEIDHCLKNGCVPVTFGSNRLRTETAGMYACALFNAINHA